MIDKSIGQLIDELIVASMKIWVTLDTISNEKDDVKVAAAARTSVIQNARRTKLIQEIDERLAAGNFSQISDGSKTYAKD